MPRLEYNTSCLSSDLQYCSSAHHLDDAYFKLLLHDFSKSESQFQLGVWGKKKEDRLLLPLHLEKLNATVAEAGLVLLVQWDHSASRCHFVAYYLVCWQCRRQLLVGTKLWKIQLTAWWLVDSIGAQQERALVMWLIRLTSTSKPRNTGLLDYFILIVVSCIAVWQDGTGKAKIC